MGRLQRIEETVPESPVLILGGDELTERIPTGAECAPTTALESCFVWLRNGRSPNRIARSL